MLYHNTFYTNVLALFVHFVRCCIVKMVFIAKLYFSRETESQASIETTVKRRFTGVFQKMVLMLSCITLHSKLVNCHRHVYRF